VNCQPVVLTVDVEDYFMSPESIAFEQWSSFEDRVQVGLNRLLDMLSTCGRTATFFFLGYVAERHPEAVISVAKAGHEVAVHHYWHQPYEQIGKARFLEGLRRTKGILEDLIGTKVIGHRAPMWSVRRDMPWVFEGLLENGFQYDSSLFPIRTYLYGDAGAEPEPHWLNFGGGRILEVPPSTQTVFGRRIPVGGGFFLRAYPLGMTRWGINRRLRSGRSVVLYVHPWELDPGHPRLQLPTKLAWIHAVGLNRLGRKMTELVKQYEFTSLGNALSRFEAIAGGTNA